MISVLQMGTHGAYVWSAYGITLAVLVLNAWLARSKRVMALRRAREGGQPELAGKRPTVRRVQ